QGRPATSPAAPAAAGSSKTEFTLVNTPREVVIRSRCLMQRGSAGPRRVVLPRELVPVGSRVEHDNSGEACTSKSRCVRATLFVGDGLQTVPVELVSAQRVAKRQVTGRAGAGPPIADKDALRHDVPPLTPELRGDLKQKLDSLVSVCRTDFKAHPRSVRFFLRELWEVCQLLKVPCLPRPYRKNLAGPLQQFVMNIPNWLPADLAPSSAELSEDSFITLTVMLALDSIPWEFKFNQISRNTQGLPLARWVTNSFAYLIVTWVKNGAMPARLRQEAPPPPGEHKATASSSASRKQQGKDLSKTTRGQYLQHREGAPMGGGTPDATSANKPHLEKVLFKTRKGLRLQFDANPNLDQWINSEVKHDKLRGKYVKHTGEVLKKAERDTYTQYRHRHVARCRLGDDADKLSRITNKYMPRIADESRVFVLRFPEQATQLLRRARKIRRKVKAKQKGEERNVPGRCSKKGDGKQRVTKAIPGQPPRGGKESKHVTKEGTTHVPEQPLKKSKTEERIQHAIKARDEEEESVPDWGDDTFDTEENPEPANTATGTAKGDAQASWPWGDKGRPSDRGERAGILGQRPSEPTTPRRQSAAGESQQPLQRAIQLVQAHMARRRAEQGLPPAGPK
ncbi:unnamed protein product, partial [Symbiodinium microadriaticum]